MHGDPLSQEHVQARIEAVLNLLNRVKILEDISRRQSPSKAELVEALVHRQALAELHNRLLLLAAADLAELIERVPPVQRQLIWEQIDNDRAGDALGELPEAIAEDLVQATPAKRLQAICLAMDLDDLAYIAPFVPKEVMDAVQAALAPRTRSWLAAARSYPEDSVGRLMTNEMLVIDEGETVKAAMKLVRAATDLPPQCDALFVVDAMDRFKGSLPLMTLLRSRPRQPVAEVMVTDVMTFSPTTDAADAALAFERYDLLSAPVVDSRGRLIGRLTSHDMIDFVRDEAEEAALRRDGLSARTDLFGHIWEGARQRWLWLGINLLTAFLASRVIGVFADSIEKLVALATLMPIVASIGGNTGNQTIALFVRGLALNQITSGNLRYLALKELGISVINGLLWGSVMGLVAFALYRDPLLGGVMALATLLNLIVAAVAGIGMPIGLQRAGRDPAYGSSVLLTFITDSMGFLIFLGLATLVLL